MATLTLRPVIPAQPVQSSPRSSAPPSARVQVRSPVLDRYPIRRARLARHKAYEALQLARKAMKDRHIPAARGYLDEAAAWHSHAIDLEARDHRAAQQSALCEVCDHIEELHRLGNFTHPFTPRRVPGGAS